MSEQLEYTHSCTRCGKMFTVYTALDAANFAINEPPCDAGDQSEGTMFGHDIVPLPQPPKPARPVFGDEQAIAMIKRKRR